MKKSTITLAVLLFAAIQTMFSANINIIISGLSYSPSSTVAVIGDVVTIAASANHPLVQVDQTTWNANGNTPLGSGWGTKTSAYTFTITAMGDIYYVCSNHVSTANMKGMITVQQAGIQQATAAAYSISLYPNPITNGEFSVKAEGYNTSNGKVLVYDEAGKLLESHVLTGVVTTVKTKLPAGAYFYTVMIGTQAVQRSKFVVAEAK